jgi:hypothetical protein
MIAECDRTPPLSVTRAATVGRTTVQPASNVGHTRTSPRRTGVALGPQGTVQLRGSMAASG